MLKERVQGYKDGQIRNDERKEEVIDHIDIDSKKAGWVSAVLEPSPGNFLANSRVRPNIFPYIVNCGFPQ
jgi:hypothetical protein